MWRTKGFNKPTYLSCSPTKIWREPNWVNPKLISIIITCHGNYGKFITRCIESIITQPYPSKEIITIDDNTKNMPYLSCLSYKVNYSNANKSRNFGFKKSNGYYVMFIDADDWLSENAISKLIYNIEKYNTSVSAGRYLKINWDTKEILQQRYSPDTFDEQYLKLCNYIQTTTVIKRSNFIGFNENHIQCYDDWEMWLRMINKGMKFHYTNEPILYYSSHCLQNHSYYGTRNYKLKYQKISYDNMLLTIGTAFGGKKWCFEKYFKRLSELKFPKNRTRLVFYDDSRDAKFNKQLQKKIKKIRSKYNNIILLSGLVEPMGYQEYAVAHHVSRIYNNMKSHLIKGSHVYMWEDDEIPPKDIIEQLSTSLYEDVGIVSGFAKSRQTKLPLVWHYDKAGLHYAFSNKIGTEEVGAVSLGNTLIPSYFIKILNFKGSTGEIKGHDIIFSRDVAKLGYKIIVNWNAKCLHLDRKGIITPKIKLHLGSGYDYKPDFVNIDNDTNLPIDSQWDLTKELPYPDESVDLIETHHLVEHLNFPRKSYLMDFANLFKDWHRVLKGNGKLIIECPDFDATVKLYNKRPNDENLMINIFGSGDNNAHNHYIGWNYNRLKIVLKQAGFDKIKKKKARDYHAKDSPCLRVEAIK